MLARPNQFDDDIKGDDLKMQEFIRFGFKIGCVVHSYCGFVDIIIKQIELSEGEDISSAGESAYHKFALVRKILLNGKVFMMFFWIVVI